VPVFLADAALPDSNTITSSPWESLVSTLPGRRVKPADFSIILPQSGLKECGQLTLRILPGRPVVSFSACLTSAPMNIADLLCSPVPTEEEEEEKHRAPPPVEQCAVAPVEPPSVGSPSSKAKRAQVVTKKKCRSFAVLPDKQRKRQYYMSKTQKQRRRDHEAFESRVFNLTLDVNALKQEVKRLMEIRDLQVTQLLLSRHHLENDLLLATETMVRSLRHDRSGPTDCRYLSTTEEGRAGHAPAARGQCGNMFEFAIQMDKIKSTCIIKDLRVLTFVEEGAEPEDEATAEVRQVCGPGGGCLVEVVGDFTPASSAISSWPCSHRQRATRCCSLV
jgi:hypothetical protein